MNYLTFLGLCCLALVACGDPSNGTFVGNPGLSASYPEASGVQARGGELAGDVTLYGCDSLEEPAWTGPFSFEFDENATEDAVEVPEGAYCRLVLDASSLLMILLNEETGDEVSLSTGEFQLDIETSFVVREGGRYVVRLGDDQWLLDIVGSLQPGANVIDGSNPELDSAFDTLMDSTSVEDVTPPTTTTLTAPPEPSILPTAEPTPLAGRLIVSDYPVSPSGLATSGSGCSTGNGVQMAAPVPPATMRVLDDDEDAGVGWCEGDVAFFEANESVLETAVQVDFSDLSTYEVSYNGQGTGCTGVHCNQLMRANGESTGLSCSILAVCDADGNYAATGVLW